MVPVILVTAVLANVVSLPKTRMHVAAPEEDDADGLTPAASTWRSAVSLIRNNPILLSSTIVSIAMNVT